MTKKLLITIFLFSCSICRGQDAELEKRLDTIFKSRFEPGQPGCAILIAKEGKVIYNKAFGSADLELNVPLTTGMVFKIGSITKQFTAVAILQLVEQGRISLQDSLQKFIPDFPSKGHKISIENLLTHTSGIRDYMQIDYGNTNIGRLDFSPVQVIDSFKMYPLEFAPGTRYSYSNSGYFLLGYIIEKLSGKSYNEYMKDAVFLPLGLANSFLDDGYSIIPNRVSGYRKEDGINKNAEYLSNTIPYAAGGMLSTTGDLFKWHLGISSKKLIKKETLDQAYTAYKLKDGSEINYGYGWQVMNKGSARSIEHGGRINGFTSIEAYYPEQEIFMALFINYEDALNVDLLSRISGVVLGKPLQSGLIKPDIETLRSYTGTYRLSSDKKRTIVILQEGDQLFAKISGQNAFELLFQSSGRFQLKNIMDATGEFIRQNGQVEKMVIHQNGVFEWIKVR